MLVSADVRTSNDVDIAARNCLYSLSSQVVRGYRLSSSISV